MQQWITHIKIYTNGCKINKKQTKKNAYFKSEKMRPLEL